MPVHFKGSYNPTSIAEHEMSHFNEKIPQFVIAEFSPLDLLNFLGQIANVPCKFDFTGSYHNPQARIYGGGLEQYLNDGKLIWLNTNTRNNIQYVHFGLLYGAHFFSYLLYPPNQQHIFTINTKQNFIESKQLGFYLKWGANNIFDTLATL